MKKIFLGLSLLIAAGLCAFGFTFTAETLPADGAERKVEVPAAHPPEGMKLSAIKAGRMLSQAGFAYRGGAITEPRIFGMGGILVQHPQGTVLVPAPGHTPGSIIAFIARPAANATPWWVIWRGRRKA